jgi:hypothetical protein
MAENADSDFFRIKKTKTECVNDKLNLHENFFKPTIMPDKKEKNLSSFFWRT